MFKMVVALVGLVATVVGIAVSVRALLNPAPANPGSNAAVSTAFTSAVVAESSTASASSATSNGDVTNSVAALGPPVGECLSSDGVVVPCTVVHRFESIGNDLDHCDERAVVEYLGGNPALDVPRVLVGFQFGACVVSSSDHNEWSQSVKGAFEAGSGSGLWDELRRCEDDRLNQLVDVSCAAIHTGEYVGVADGVVPDETQCLTSTEAYLSISPYSKPELKVLTIPTSDPTDASPRCIVAVRGNNVLTESIRNVRTRALPLSPP